MSGPARVRPGMAGVASVVVSALMAGLALVPAGAATSTVDTHSAVHQTPAADTTPQPATDAQIDFTRWQGREAWSTGDAKGVVAPPGLRTGIIMNIPAGATTHTEPDGTTSKWEYSTWTSPVVELPFDATELVASWNASTPGRSWISVEMQGTYDDGSTTPWYVLGNWASGDSGVPHASVEGQRDEHSAVLTDTFAITSPDASDHTETDDDAELLLSGYQLRVTMYRSPGSLVMPRLWLLGAMASDVPDRLTVEPSTGGLAWGEELAVPRRSKSAHRDDYPEFGGGESWSSPAATTMVMEYFGVMPPREDMAWIDAGYTDPQVAHAARMTWDDAFEGTGNWSFNTAYAASFLKLDAFVTRLRSLEDIERFIDAGIPVTTSVSFREGELTGAGYGTAGHMMVVTGFTEDGDVIANDPAAGSNESVRRVYDRDQFEQVWLRTRRYLAGGEVASGSGGIAYIIQPYQDDLPDAELAGQSVPW